MTDAAKSGNELRVPFDISIREFVLLYNLHPCYTAGSGYGTLLTGVKPDACVAVAQAVRCACGLCLWSSEATDDALHRQITDAHCEW